VTARPDPRVLAAAFAAIDGGHGKGGQGKPFVLGLCGAQGSGKSTLAQAIVEMATSRGMTAAVLSLDDLYLTRDERDALARDVHPLLRTRGVPGTHDVELGLDVLDALARGDPAALPRFDKAQDDRLPRSQWDCAPANCALLVFEGWCVGARPQPEEALARPINGLEAEEDADDRWRTYANTMLAGSYQRLFARIDALMLLAAPSFEIVLDWRLQQETELRKRIGRNASGVMNARQVARFIRHYERLTRHILAEMPDRADLVVRLDENRTPLAIIRNPAASR
jgi:D-glycerate 3-kinase